MSVGKELLAELVTVRDMIRFGISRFNEENVYFGHGTDNALDESTALVLHALHLPHDLPGHFMDSRLTSEEKQRVLGLFQRRIDERIPAAYLIGEAWFANLPFVVDERVLVPRSPIAELIEAHFEPWVQPEHVGRILDMCTGSGCIAIASAVYFPGAQVDAADISDDALAVAQMNVDKHHVQDQVRLVQSDLFSNLQGEKYDIIVSNPPYVDEEDFNAMPKEFSHEPAIGLASGFDGLEATDRILANAADHLNEQGILIVEVGASMGNLMEKYPDVQFVWLDFERGGDGVFLFTREQLVEYKDCWKTL